MKPEQASYPYHVCHLCGINAILRRGMLEPLSVPKFLVSIDSSGSGKLFSASRQGEFENVLSLVGLCKAEVIQVQQPQVVIECASRQLTQGQGASS